MSESVGGFFASLKLVPDEASFQNGMAKLKDVGNQTKDGVFNKKGVDETTSSLGKLGEAQKQTGEKSKQAGAQQDAMTAKQFIWIEVLKIGLQKAGEFVETFGDGLMRIGGLLLGTTGLMDGLNKEMNKGNLGTQALNVNQSQTEFKQWRSAKGLLGVDNNPIVESVGAFKDTLNLVKNLGAGSQQYQDLATKLSYVHINIRDLFGLSGNDLGKALLEKTESAVSGKSQDKRDAILAQMDTVVKGIREFENAITNRKYGSSKEVFRRAEGLTRTDFDKENIDNSNVLSVLKVQMENLTEQTLSAMLTGLRPFLSKLSDWLGSHSDEIIHFFEKIGKILGVFASLLAPVVDALGAVLTKLGMPVIEIYKKSLFDKLTKEGEFTSSTQGLEKAHRSRLKENIAWALVNVGQDHDAVANKLDKSDIERLKSNKSGNNFNVDWLAKGGFNQLAKSIGVDIGDITVNAYNAEEVARNAMYLQKTGLAPQDDTIALIMGAIMEKLTKSKLISTGMYQ